MVTLVTFFYDINREQWDKSSKNIINDYLIPFKEYLKYDFRIIVYIDKRYYETLISMIELKSNIIIYPIDENWLNNNIWTWSKLERETEIMNSEEYKNLVRTRIGMGYPENTKPEYTIITNSKIDIINFAIENDIIDCDYYMWVDFGYFQNKTAEKYMPNSGKINLDLLNLNTVNICCVNKIDLNDKDILFTLKNAPEKIGAYLFFGNKIKLKEFQLMCHKWLEYFQSINIADDEQHIWLQCFFEKPELFTEHVFGSWHLGLKKFTI